MQAQYLAIKTVRRCLDDEKLMPTLADSWTYKTNYWLLAPPTDKTTVQWQLQYNRTHRMWLVFIKTIPHTLYQNVQWQMVKTVKNKK